MDRPNMSISRLLPALTAIALLASLAAAQERTLTPEQMEELARKGELVESPDSLRPAKLPDLTKGQSPGERVEADVWHLGPTGIIGYTVGGLKGDQIEVRSVLKGAPAEGKVRWGDVILGVNGQRFVAGQNMGLLLGNAIIEAEKQENKGRLTLTVWRDDNFLKRNGKKDIAGADIDKLINKANDDDTLYDWMSSSQKEKESRSANFKDFPIDGHVSEVELTLEVLPPYSDTSPYDCPKATRILENACKVLDKQFQPDEQGRMGRGGSIQALALVASGKPEYVERVRKWVRSSSNKIWATPKEEDNPLHLPSKSWNMSFEGLDCALYYDATHDDYVLPALTRFAVRTAKGQDGGGTWGHNWAQPDFNGGQLHGMNPGYGALNAAGNRCFFLIALAQKLGIKDPEIDRAVYRSRRFFGSYVDRGGIPYGQHAAASTDDSNGKNAGVAYALLLLGDTYGARYFAQMSTHASFTRRGGHGHDWFWHWSPYAATLCGPRGTIATQRNLRWWFTLCRRFDGGFVTHSPTGSGELRDPTATYVLHYAVPLRQTLITGKDADQSLWWTDQEYSDLLAMARSQFYDPMLVEQSGMPWPERSTDELFRLLSFFKPNAREAVAKKLGERYKAGEKDILPRLAKLLESDHARFREGACIALEACGVDATLQYMSGLARLLQDPREFVRVRAAQAMTKASSSPQTQTAVLRAVVDTHDADTMSPNRFALALQDALFSGRTALGTNPFDAGIDGKLVWDALERIMTLDPATHGLMKEKHKTWSGDTVVRLAGPLVYTAEEEQIADQMFSARRPWSLALLERLGYQEAIEASVSYLRKRRDIPRPIRTKVWFKRGFVAPEPIVNNPAAARQYLPALKDWLLDQPLATAQYYKDEFSIPLAGLIATIESAKQAEPMPRLSAQVERLFQQELDRAGTPDARLAHCRQALADPARKDYFRMNAAMDHLVGSLGDKAVGDLLPYLGHAYWRLREHAQNLAAGLDMPAAESKLVEAFASADAGTAVGIVEVLGRSKSKAARATVEKAVAHESPAVRGAAARALVTIAGDEALPPILEMMAKATTNEELGGCEAALLLHAADPAWARRVRERAIAMLPAATPAVRDSAYWILAQLGGADSLGVLRDATQTKDESRFRSAVSALSYCRDPEAEAILLDAIRADPKSPRARFAADEGVRRMVIGPQGIGTRPIHEQLDYAEALLNLVLNNDTIAYLGRIHTGRCAFILQQAMRRGAPQSAAQAIVAATADLSAADDKDRKLAEKALIDTIEFIEVTYLRGGATQQDWRTYPMWKAISAQAGKNLLKISQPEKAPLPEFDNTDIGM